MSDLLAGFLGVVLAVNPPPDATNTLSAKTNNPAQEEFHRIMLDDDNAEKDIMDWMSKAETGAKTGDESTTLTLDLRVHQRLEGIRKEYDDFVSRYPKDVDARLAFGSFLYETHDELGAEKQWESARDLAPTNPACWNNLGKVCGEGHLGKIKTAFECYDKAISLDPNESVYYYNLALVVYMFRHDAEEYYKLDEHQVFEKALDLYRHAIKLDPKNFVLYSDYAMCFYGTNPPRWQDSLEAWTQALKIAPGDVEREGVYIHLARVHIKLGQLDLARENLDMVTNDDYANLKTVLTRNLNAAVAKSAANPPAPAPAPK